MDHPEYFRNRVNKNPDEAYEEFLEMSGDGAKIEHF